MPVESSSTIAATRSWRLLAPVLAALGLRIDDHVGEEVVVAARFLEVVGERLGALLAVLLEHVEADALADQRRGEVVRRAAHEAAGQFRPGLQRLPSLDHLGVVARDLPGPVDAAVRAVRLERHHLDVLRPRLEVVERGCRANRIAERGMFGDVGNELAVDIDGAAVLQRLDVFGSGLAGAHALLPLKCCAICAKRQTSPSTPLISFAASPPTRWLGRPRLA